MKRQLDSKYKDLKFNDKRLDGSNAKIAFEKFLPFLKRTVESNAHLEFG